jgi:hypothetical protein
MYYREEKKEVPDLTEFHKAYLRLSLNEVAQALTQFPFQLARFGVPCKEDVCLWNGLHEIGYAINTDYYQKTNQHRFIFKTDPWTVRQLAYTEQDLKALMPKRVESTQRPVRISDIYSKATKTELERLLSTTGTRIEAFRPLKAGDRFITQGNLIRMAAYNYADEWQSCRLIVEPLPPYAGDKKLDELWALES